MASKKDGASASKSKPAKSGNPALRAEALATGPDPRQAGLSLWVKLFLVLTLVSSIVLTLWATWGFKGTPSAAAFLIAGMVSMLTLSLAAFILDRIIYRPGLGRAARGRAQKAVVVLIVLVIGITLLGGALGSLDKEDHSDDQGNTTKQPTEPPPGFRINEDGSVVPITPPPPPKE